MSQESGFFFKITDVTEPSMGEMVLLHRSSSGPSELYRARKDGNLRVFKALKPEHRGNPVFETMLRKEFSIGYSLEHHGICRTYSYGNVTGLGNCIEMEWIDGRTFRDFLNESPSRKKIIHVLDGICDALEHLHQRQIIHRDLKPENILVTFNGDNVKIIDFGVSDTDSNYVQKGPAGTMAYAAPEVLAGQKLDARCDIWSLGAILSEFRLFPRIAARCTRRNPDRRYRSVAELRTALNRKHILAWLVPALLCVILLVAALVLHHSEKDDEYYFINATEAIEKANSDNLD